MSQLTLKCEKFGLSRGLHDLLSSGDLVDVTLACQGQFIQAHKAVLAACSPHFRDIFKLQPWQHPIVFMHDLDVTQLQALVDFMYNGEVTVNEADLPGFLKLADALKVSGLTPQDKENETRLNITVPDEVMIHLPPSPPAPPRPAKIARRTLDRDVSQRDPSPALIPVASSKVESSTTHSWADNVVSNLTSDIKLEVEELPDLSELQHDPISTQEFETAEEEKQGEDEDQDVETIQEDDSWYKAGPSTSQQSSCMPSTESQAGGQQPVAISSRGRVLRQVRRLTSCEIYSSSNSEEDSNDCNTSKHPNKRGPNLSNDCSTSKHSSHRQVDEITLNESEEESSQTKDNVNSGGPDKAPYKLKHCVVCDETFLDLYYLRKHISEKHNKDVLSTKTCPFCFKHFPSSVASLKHLKSSHPEYRHNCNYCSSTFSSHQYLLNHQFQIHGQDSNPYSCFVCKKVFSTANRMHDHNARFHAERNS